MSFADDITNPDSQFQKTAEAMRIHSRTRSFDPKCWELAEAFLQDVDDYPAGTTGKLAAEIQQLVEDFIDDLKR